MESDNFKPGLDIEADFYGFLGCVEEKNKVESLELQNQ